MTEEPPWEAKIRTAVFSYADRTRDVIVGGEKFGFGSAQGGKKEKQTRDRGSARGKAVAWVVRLTGGCSRHTEFSILYS